MHNSDNKYTMHTMYAIANNYLHNTCTMCNTLTVYPFYFIQLYTADTIILSILFKPFILFMLLSLLYYLYHLYYLHWLFFINVCTRCTMYDIHSSCIFYNPYAIYIIIIIKFKSRFS